MRPVVPSDPRAAPAVVALTPGDPDGIGPEVALSAARQTLATGQPGWTPVLVGAPGIWRRAADVLRWQQWDSAVAVVDPKGAGERPWQTLPEVSAIAAATRGALDGVYDAICTAPITKERLFRAGFPYPGHTEYLAHLCGCTGQEVMAFSGGRLRVALLTTHLPLREVADALEPQLVLRVVRTFERALRQRFHIPAPRIALCGLNPHAGEGGHLGREEQDVLAPGVAMARADGIDCAGPFPADSLFSRAVQGEFDGVVACYHDQGLVAVKTLDPGRSVHLTLGLPIVRTSPDHGSARALAGSGRADAGPMLAAAQLAAALSPLNDRLQPGVRRA